MGLKFGTGGRGSEASGIAAQRTGTRMRDELITLAIQHSIP